MSSFGNLARPAFVVAMAALGACQASDPTAVQPRTLSATDAAAVATFAADARTRLLPTLPAAAQPGLLAVLDHLDRAADLGDAQAALTNASALVTANGLADTPDGAALRLDLAALRARLGQPEPGR